MGGNIFVDSVIAYFLLGRTIFQRLPTLLAQIEVSLTRSKSFTLQFAIVAPSWLSPSHPPSPLLVSLANLQKCLLYLCILLI